MRVTHLFAVLLAVAGIGAITPASAATTPRVAATPLVEPGVPSADANQYQRRWTNSGYRIRYGNRGYGYRGYRGYPRYRSYRPVYRPRYFAPRPRWRGNRVTCTTSWRYGRPHRVCFRRW